MKKLLTLFALVLLANTFLFAQDPALRRTISTDRLKAKVLEIDSFKVKGFKIEEVSNDTTFENPSDLKIPTQLAVRKYVENNGGAVTTAEGLEKDTVGAATLNRDVKFAVPPANPTVREKTTGYFNPTDTIFRIYEPAAEAHVPAKRIMYINDFGAIPDDGLNDDLAFSVAYTYAVASKAELHLREGRYNFSTQLTINQPVTIKGDNNKVEIFMNSSASAQNVFQVFADNVTIEGIKFISVNDQIDLTQAAVLSSNVRGVVADANNKNLVVKDCHFANNAQGLKVRDMDGFQAINLTFDSCAIAMLLTRDTNVYISNMKSDRTYYSTTANLIHHIYFTGGSNIKILNSHFIGGGGGQAINMLSDGVINIDRILIDNCSFKNTTPVFAGGVDILTVSNCSWKDAIGLTINRAKLVNISNPDWRNTASTSKGFLGTGGSSAQDSMTVNITGGQFKGPLQVTCSEITSVNVNNSTFHNSFDLTTTVQVFPVKSATGLITTLNINNCIFRNDAAGLGAGSEVWIRPERSARVYVTNSTFINESTAIPYVSLNLGDSYTHYKDCKKFGYTNFAYTFATGNQYYVENCTDLPNNTLCAEVYKTGVTSDYITRNESYISSTGLDTITINQYHHKTGRELTILSSDGAPVHIDTEGSDLINGAAFYETSSAVTLFAISGGNWMVVGDGKTYWNNDGTSILQKDIADNVLIGKTTAGALGKFQVTGGITNDNEFLNYGTFRDTSIQSVGSISTNQDDLTPTNWSTNSVFSIDAAANFDITGFGALPGGSIRTIRNEGASDTITIKVDDGGSSPANRIAPGLDYLILPGREVDIKYDAGNQRFYIKGGVLAITFILVLFLTLLLQYLLKLI